MTTKSKKEGPGHSIMKEKVSARALGEHMESVQKRLIEQTGQMGEAAEAAERGEPGERGADRETERFSPADGSWRAVEGNSFCAFFLCLVYNIF